jgi:two-component system, cell cycle sensor histidine kinase and response regulator CckA
MDNELEQRCRARKLEALGRLAGSLSHDLNNILGAIEGYATLLLNAMPKDDPARPDIEEIHKAERRAAELTRQLLVFSRGGGGRMTAVRLDELMAGLAKKAQPLVGDGIVIELSCAPDLKPAQAEAAQLEQALLDMVLNARDAMPEGGRIRLTARNADLGGAAPKCPRPVDPGTGFACISVSDSGVGMTPETMDRLFEPLFTTKPKGKGTGLCLSAAYGIVTKHNGWMEVDSEPGKGSVFTVYLPQVPAGIRAEPERENAAREPRGLK